VLSLSPHLFLSLKFATVVNLVKLCFFSKVAFVPESEPSLGFSGFFFFFFFADKCLLEARAAELLPSMWLAQSPAVLGWGMGGCALRSPSRGPFDRPRV
jgi:hypothetical protein